MARCKIFSPAMLVLHFLLILVFSNLVISVPAPAVNRVEAGPIEKGGHESKPPPSKGKGPGDQFKDIIDRFKKIHHPRSIIRKPVVPIPRPPIPAPIDPPSAAPLSDTTHQSVGRAVVEEIQRAQAVEILKECEKKGIDIFGDIPSDATRVPANHPDSPLKARDGMVFENMTFIHTFEVNSHASLWASAQVLTSQFPELVNGTEAYRKALEKRQNVKADPGVFVESIAPVGALAHQGKKIGIGMWEGGRLDWTTNPRPCQGKGWWIDTVQHNIVYLANILTFSVGVSYRSLGTYDHERLDFFTYSGRPGFHDCDVKRYSAGERTPASCWRHGPASARCFMLWQNPRWKAPAVECKGRGCWRSNN